MLIEQHGLEQAVHMAIIETLYELVGAIGVCLTLATGQVNVARTVPPMNLNKKSLAMGRHHSSPTPF